MSSLLLDDANASPWVLFDELTPLENDVDCHFHILGCVHKDLRQSRVGSERPVREYVKTEDMKRLIAEHCGLAGVIPNSRTFQRWIGEVLFTGEKGSTATIFYNNHEDDYRLISQVLEILERFCGIVTYLQKERLCCSSFTMMCFVSPFKHVELKHIDFVVAVKLQKSLRSLLENWITIDRILWLRRSKGCAEDIIAIVGSCDTVNRVLATQVDVTFTSTCLDAISLAAQILTLGLYSYSQAHIGSIYPPFLMGPLRDIRLCGVSKASSGRDGSNINFVQVNLLRLTCLGNMTKDRVAVFGEYGAFDNESEASFDVLATPEDVVETWDARNLIMDPNAPYGEEIHAIEVNGGHIRPYLEDPGSSSTSQPWRRLHWSQDTDFEICKDPFSLRSKALIGVATVNDPCPMDENETWCLANVHMHNLGTENKYWEAIEANAGFQSGQYLVAQFNKTWIKRPGTTLKHRHLQPDLDLSFLESDWGLQISYCTGAARRVSLCHLLADVIPPFMEARLRKPASWKRLETEYKVIDALRRENFGGWFQELEASVKEDLERIIRYVLLTLQDTGVDRSGKFLYAVWPRAGNPFQCIKIPCERTNLWAKMLADSEDCATFAYVTSLCLETDSCKCQGVRKASWLNSSKVFHTAVSCMADTNAMMTVTEVETWSLRHNRSYLIIKPDILLLGTVALWKSLDKPHPEPRLYVSASEMPASILARVSKIMPVSRRRERIREKQFAGAKAQRVSVMAKASGWAQALM